MAEIYQHPDTGSSHVKDTSEPPGRTYQTQAQYTYDPVMKAMMVWPVLGEELAIRSFDVRLYSPDLRPFDTLAEL